MHLSSVFRRIVLAVVLATGAATPAEDAPSTVHFTIDAAADVKSISRYVYGVNTALDGPYAHCPFTRVGGNRLTAYNWLNNASNAGNDWQFQNDNIMRGGDVPGAAIAPRIENAVERKAAIALTIPMTGYVAADKKGGGDVRRSGVDYLKTRFRPSVARKGSAFTLTPAPDGATVYQDEFVNWVRSTYPKTHTDPLTPVFYCLDNEPDLWPSTHAEVHPAAPTYAELVARAVEYAKAIKNVSPEALIFAPGNYGWQGYVNLQNAPDNKGRDFQTFYLSEMKAAEKGAGKRLLDVLDVHWYPEAQGGGVRIGGAQADPKVVAARLQAPRSLWDKTYTETSWITQWSTKGPIELLPRLRRKIEGSYPGTKLAITEYNYGGGGHISGAIAQADVLGIFGREGVFAANEWPMAADERFIAAAFEMFRDFDGHGGAFGDASVRATTDKAEETSVYASVDSRGAKAMTLVAINKTDHAVAARVKLDHAGRYTSAEVYQLVGTSPKPVHADSIVLVEPAAFTYSMPAYSVSTIRLGGQEARRR